MHIYIYIQKIWSELAKTCQKLVFWKETSFWPEFAISDQILHIHKDIYIYAGKLVRIGKNLSETGFFESN